MNNGGGKFFITLQRNVASSVALNVRVSSFVEDTICVPSTLKFATTTMQVTKMHTE